MKTWRDAVRLALGTLTVLPTRPPERLDRAVAGRAMVLAPLVGLLLALPAVVLVPLLYADDLLRPGGPPPLLVAALLVGALALLTRGMHLDGLADTADGLGSGKPADGALTIMGKSDIGPFGVLTLVLVLLVQVAALGHLVSRGVGAPALVVALVVSRLALPMACSRGIPAARPEGLGRLVASTVGRAGMIASTALALGAVLVGVALAAAAGPTATLGVAAPAANQLVVVQGSSGLGALVLGLLVGVALPLVVAGLFLRRCVRRLGGVTGDVLGACVEVAFTASLVATALLLPR
ncbi:MAG: adenosylcobinamide-GDP ribazoletransferase [Nocardioidaceae bacterium]